MAESEGTPRKTTTYNRFEGMVSQNDRYNVKPNEMWWLENIMRTAPKKLHSVPGPTGPLFTIGPIPPVCTDSTERGQQALVAELRFDQTSSFHSSGFGQPTSWSYISPLEEIYTLIADGGCGGGNVPYSDLCCQINHWQTPAVLTHPPLIDPNAFLSAGGGKLGVSDTPCYSFAEGEYYYPLTAGHISTSAPLGYFLFARTIFGKIANRIYTNPNQSAGSPQGHIVVYDANSGGVAIDDWTTITNFFTYALAPTNLYVYALTQSRSPGGTWAVKRLNRSDGTLAANFDLTSINPALIALVNDNLIYVITAGFTNALYYIKNFNELVYVGKFDSFTVRAPGTEGTATFVNGFFYYGGGGRNISFSPDIYRLEIPCPDSGAIVATVSRVQNTVAAGSPITVNWADILQPDATDRLELRPAPAVPGDLGFVGPSLANLTTGSAASGSAPFTIPALTTPGNYIIELTTAVGALLIATTAPFAVT